MAALSECSEVEEGQQSMPGTGTSSPKDMLSSASPSTPNKDGRASNAPDDHSSAAMSSHEQEHVSTLPSCPNHLQHSPVASTLKQQHDSTVQATPKQALTEPSTHKEQHESTSTSLPKELQEHSSAATPKEHVSPALEHNEQHTPTALSATEYPQAPEHKKPEAVVPEATEALLTTKKKEQMTKAEQLKAKTRKSKKAAPSAKPVPLPPPLSAKFQSSFAYKTIRDRLPIILTRVIDALFRARMEIERRQGAEAREESKQIVGRLSKLRNELVTDKPFLRIKDDFQDAPQWNAVLDDYVLQHGMEPRWFEAPWLYAECYFYRRIFEAFQLSRLLRGYDPFAKQKREALYESLEAVRTLAEFVRKNTHQGASLETLQPTVLRLLEVSLWGNRCDLSISGGVPNAESTTALQLTHSLRSKILSNHFPKLWAHLSACRARTLDGEATRLHLVLDNSGYELATDLALADFLQQSSFVASICFHAKVMPWFVSDVTRADLFQTLRELREYDQESTRALAQRCLHRLETNVWSVMDDGFWTLPHDYAVMASLRPDLHRFLESGDLILFKGDLNYRKLVGDLQWDPTVPFESALRGFTPTFLCTMRTIKADTVAGIEADIVKEMAYRSPDWMLTGEYALVQCAEKASR